MLGSTLNNFMKKLIASVGLAALGVSTLHAQYSPGPTPAEMAKPWSLGLTLRGFYDDNPLTLPNAAARTTYGTEVSPSASLNHTVNNTTCNLSYVYDWRYYESAQHLGHVAPIQGQRQTELFRAVQHAGQRMRSSFPRNRRSLTPPSPLRRCAPRETMSIIPASLVLHRRIGSQAGFAALLTPTTFMPTSKLSATSTTRRVSALSAQLFRPVGSHGATGHRQSELENHE